MGESDNDDDLPRQPAEVTAEIRQVRASLEAEQKALAALVTHEDAEQERRKIIDSINSLGQYLTDLYAERDQARRYWR